MNDHKPSWSWRSTLPGWRYVSAYRMADFGHDFLAGLVLPAILVPTGMGYASAAGLPVIYGLYATLVSMFAYSFLGPSRILILGPDSSLAALIAASVLPLAGEDVNKAVALAALLALMSGTLCVLAGWARFGFLTDLLSKPIRYGYLNGIVIIVILSQLPAMLGVSSKSPDALGRLHDVTAALMGGKINVASTILAGVSLGILVIIRRFAPFITGNLIVMLLSIGAVALWRLDVYSSVAVVGALPQGLPRFSIPTVSIQEVNHLIVSAIAIAVISFADMSVLSRTFAHRNNEKIDPNRELIALGGVNLLTGFFQGFPVSGSTSRTSVAVASGARSPVAGIVGGLCIGLLLIFGSNLLVFLPKAVLAAIVVYACLSLLEIKNVIRLFKLRRSELGFSVVCFVGVLWWGTVQGIMVAISAALLAFIWRAWRPYDAVLGRIDGVKGYHDVRRHPEAKRIPGLVLFRWDAPLFFANASVFQEHVLRAVRESPTTVRRVVVAAEPVTDIDITAADMLAELLSELHSEKIEFCFAEMKGPVKDRLKKYGLFETFGGDRFYPTLGQAVDHYVQSHQVPWQDWDKKVSKQDGAM